MNCSGVHSMSLRHVLVEQKVTETAKLVATCLYMYAVNIDTYMTMRISQRKIHNEHVHCNQRKTGTCVYKK